MVMATCLAATAAGCPCDMTCDGPRAGGGIAVGAAVDGEGGGVGAVVVDCGLGCTGLAAVAARSGLISQPARTLATPSPRRPRSERRSIPKQCGQVMMSWAPGFGKAVGIE